MPGSSTGKSGMSSQYRRSMEDETRPLPKGWVRTFDPESHHQFYVDTTKEPPRSIWTHPYDDDEYLHTLSGEERERIEQESLGRGHPPSKQDIISHDTDEEDDDHHASSSGPHGTGTTAELPPRPDGDKGKKSFGRKLKDKMTGMSHEERVQERKRRAEEEERLYQQHLKIRQAMAKAVETGQPQLIGKDKQGKDIYIEPPSTGGYGGGLGGGYPGVVGGGLGGGYGGGYGGGGYGYDPYGTGIYSTPNARYIRPSNPYNRPYGYGYGGGYGMPLMMGMGGGLLGGAMLGGLMF